MELAIKLNHCAANVHCALCGGSTDTQAGPELFVDGTLALVCWECGRNHAPVLVALLERHAGLVQGIRETSGEETPGEDTPYGGGCPVCGKSDGYLNVGQNHWAHCDTHKTRWWFGSNLTSDWHHEDETVWQSNQDLLNAYRIVVPLPAIDET